MSINIYVGNLSFDSTEEQLRELFEAHGTVLSAKIITDQFTGRSKGFGFVEMGDREEGMNAIQALNSLQFDGRSIKVNEARPRGDSRRDPKRDKRSRW